LLSAEVLICGVQSQTIIFRILAQNYFCLVKKILSFILTSPASIILYISPSPQPTRGGPTVHTLSLFTFHGRQSRPASTLSEPELRRWLATHGAPPPPRRPADYSVQLHLVGSSPPEVSRRPPCRPTPTATAPPRWRWPAVCRTSLHPLRPLLLAGGGPLTVVPASPSPLSPRSPFSLLACTSSFATPAMGRGMPRPLPAEPSPSSSLVSTSGEGRVAAALEVRAGRCGVHRSGDVLCSSWCWRATRCEVADGGVASRARDSPPRSPSPAQRGSGQCLPWREEARLRCRPTSALGRVWESSHATCRLPRPFLFSTARVS
jgi:hypothetical protein